MNQYLVNFVFFYFVDLNMVMNVMVKNIILDVEIQVSLKKEREREKEFMRINEGNECFMFWFSNLIRVKFLFCL